MNFQDESEEIISGILSSLNKEDDPVTPMLEAFMEKKIKDIYLTGMDMGYSNGGGTHSYQAYKEGFEDGKLIGSSKLWEPLLKTKMEPIGSDFLGDM